MPRLNFDSVVNPAGLAMLNFCKLNDLIICNSHVTPGSSNKWTFVDHQGCSVGDYLLISALFYDNVCSMQIANSIESYHFPITAFIRYSVDVQQCSNDITVQPWTLRPKSNFHYLTNDVHLLYDRCLSVRNINSAYAAKISGLFQLSNERRFNVICYNSLNRKKVSVREPWFDDDCYQAEKSAYEILSAFREGKCALNVFNILLSKTIMTSLSLNALFMSKIKEINFVEMLRSALHDFGKI